MIPTPCNVDGVNLLEWACYNGGNEVMDIPNNGYELPGEWIEFTGPYGGDCEDAFVFHTPATPSGEPPPGAVRLVIQFLDWDDIEFLTAGFQVIPTENSWGPDPEPVDPCEVPEFCEPPVASDDIQLDLGCIPYWNIGEPCENEGEDAAIGSLAGYSAARNAPKWRLQL